MRGVVHGLALPSWHSVIRTSSDSAALDRRLDGVRYIMGNEIQSIPS